MTRFVDVPTMSRLVQEIGVARFIGELADAIRADFLRWPEFDKTARVASHSPIGVIELMPVSDAKRYAFKYVNGHPGNPARGLSTVMAFGVLAEVETGYPLLLSELTAGHRAAHRRHLADGGARAGAARRAPHGADRQRRAERVPGAGLPRHLGIDEIAVFDVDPRATDKLMRNLAAYPVAAAAVAPHSIAEAVRGADIVTTLTADKADATILTPEMIEPGMHINAVGGDCPGKTELHADVLRGARVFVEYEPQTRIEGDIQQMPADFPVVELWRVLAGTRGRPRSAPTRSRCSTRSASRWRTSRPCATCTTQADAAQSGPARRAGALGRGPEGPVPLHAQRRLACRHASRGVSGMESTPCSSFIQAPAAVVMVRPHRFTPNPETAADNAFQSLAAKEAAQAVAGTAHREVTAAAERLEAEGVRVHLFEDEGERDTPDSVFPNNWFSTHSGGHVAIYPMYAPSRRRERRADVIEMLKSEYRVQDVIDYSGLEQDGLFLEGTGAMVLDHLARVAYTARSNRADPVALERFSTHFNFEPMAVRHRR